MACSTRRLAALLLLLGASACPMNDPPERRTPLIVPPPYPTRLAPPPTPPTAPAPAPNPPSPVAALGWPCASDSDPQCPFGRCLRGRCGGCVSPGDCKPGAACAATVAGPACVPIATAPAPTMAAPTQVLSASYAEVRARCLELTNVYRARVGAPPVSYRADQDACTDAEAARDSASGKPHGSFGACGEMAQNVCPGWPGPPDQMVTPCLKSMFDEGPGEPYSAHGHYLNMTNRSYAGVVCGFHADGNGQVWLIQNFF